MPTSIAIVGAGYMAREHARAFTALPNVTISGIYSRTPARAESLAREFGNIPVARSIEHLYESTQADLLVIAVSELACEAAVLKAAQFPWKILAEKPVGLNHLAALSLQERLGNKSDDVFVALNRRSYQSVLQAQSALSQTSNPRVVFLQDQEGPAHALKHGTPPDVVANWMYANSIHLIDLLHVFCRGTVASVENVIPFRPDQPELVLSHITFSSGDIGVYSALWDRPGPWSLAVSSPELYAELKPLETLALKPAGVRRAETATLSDIDTRFKPGLLVQAQAALLAVRDEPNTLPTFASALDTMHLIEQIYAP